MDKKLLDALNNLAFALEDISNSLSSKQLNSDVGKSLQGADLSNTLLSISESIADLKSDTKDIKDGQNTIIKMLKSQKKNEKKVDTKKRNVDDVKGNGMSNPFVGAGEKDNTSKIKDGLTSILLIAVGVLAVGMALKLVGPVDVLSVLAISTAVLILAKSFSEINKVEGLNAKKILIASFALVAISFAVVAVSYILANVTEISPIKLFTAILISGVFTVLSYGLGNMSKGISGMKNPLATVVMLPLVMIALSYAIMESSKLLAQSTPITMSNFLTAVGVSIIFVIAAYSLPIISKAMEKINVGKIILLPVIMVLMSVAIMASSKILAQTETIDPGKLFNIVLVSIAVSIAAIVAGVTMGIIGQFNVSTIVQGGINLVLICGAIVLASHLLALGDYSKPISIDWVVGAGGALLAFGIATVALGVLSMTGVGAGAIIAGALMTLVIAESIVATSHILNKGNYSGGPTVGWSTATGLALLAFGYSSVMLGALVVGTLGVGALAIAAGAEAVSIIAQSIVDTSFILNKGNFTGGPTASWAGGVAIALAAFSPIYGMLLANKIMSIFGGGISPEDFNNAIKTVSVGIVYSASLLKGGNFTGGPTKEWASGVATALGAFSPVYKMLLDNSGIFSSGVSAEDFNKAIATVSNGIIYSASIFNGANGIFNVGNVPSKEWGAGVAGAINAFAPVYKFISDNSGFFSGDATEKMGNSIQTIAWSIVNVSKILSFGKWQSIIPSGYVASIASEFSQYMDLIKKLSGGSGGIMNNLFGVNSVAKSMVAISVGIDALAKSMDNLSSSIDVDKLNALRNLTGTVVMMSLMDSDQFGSMMDKLEEKSNVFASVINSMTDSGQGGGSKSGSGVNVKSPSAAVAQGGRSNDDLYNMLGSIDKKLGVISSNTNIMSNYINSLNSDIKLRKK